MLYRKWHSEQLNTAGVENLKNSLGISTLLAKVLVGKGVTTKEQAEEMFLGLTPLTDPYLMKDMDKAVA